MPSSIYARTLPQQLQAQAKRIPNAIAIRQKEYGIWNPLTWHAYFEQASRVGLALHSLGLHAGGHIAVISENRVEWVLAQLGAGLIGGVTVGVYPTSPANEVAYVLEHSDAEIIFCEDQEQSDKVLQVVHQLPKLKKIVVFERKGLQDTQSISPGLVIGFAELRMLGDTCTAENVVSNALQQQSLSDTGLIIYTSGSTGKPKGAMLSYANIAAMAPGIIERLGLTSRTSHLSYLPLCHVAEQMLTTFVPLYLGSRVDFGESIRTVQEDLREVAPSMFLGVPRIWEKLHSSISLKMNESSGWRLWLFTMAVRHCSEFAHKASHQRTLWQSLVFFFYYTLIFRALQNFIGLRKVQVALTGAAPISPAIVKFFRTIGIPLIEVYGMTETSGMVLGQHLDGVVFGTVGVPTLGLAHKIAANGELHVKGAVVFKGYYKNQDATDLAVQNGWLHTGDVVEEKNGHIRIVDRLKDIMITAGGKNLTPSEIENTMKSSPFIKECVVVADGRKFVSALIQIDYEPVAQWAESKNIPYTHFRSLVESEQVKALIQQEIHTRNAAMAEVAHIRKFHLLVKELDHDDGEVTATMKVRRASIYKSYANEIEALYS